MIESPATSGAPPLRSARVFFVDANILMYRAGADLDWRKTCERALLQAEEAAVGLATNAEVLQEILHHYFSRRRPLMAQAVHHAALEFCDEIIPVTEHHTTRALALLLEHPRLSARDAVHLATMEDRGIHTILSADQDFDGVPGVDRIDPRDFIRG